MSPSLFYTLRKKEEMEDEMMKRRKLRDERMANRRAFLRSYPLRWDDDDEGIDEEEAVSGNMKCSKVKSVMKGMIHWGYGRILLLRKMKDKVAFYLVACHPFGFKTTTKFLTAS